MKSKSEPSKKLVMLIGLCLVSMLIAGASAAVYFSLVLQPSVTISQASVVFAQGNDWPIGSSLGSNSTWAGLSLKAYPNATLVYEQPLNITNTDTVSHTFRLRHVSISPASGQSQVGNFTFVNIVVQDTAGTQQASFNYTTTGNTWNTPAATTYMTLLASTSWTIYIETKAVAGANDVTANMQVAIDVQ